MPRFSQVTGSERSSVSARSTSEACRPWSRRPHRQPEPARILALDGQHPLRDRHGIARRRTCEELRGETSRVDHGATGRARARRRRALQRADLAHREQHAGHERLAGDRVVADRERLPEPPKMTSWCATRPGQAHGVDRLVHVAARLADQLGRARGGARRGVELRVVVQLDDLALGHVLGRAAWATSIISTAPIAKFGATKRFARAHALELARSRRRWCPSRSARRPRGSRARSPSAVSGCEKSTTTSASPSTSASATSSSGSARPDERHVLGALDRVADRLPHPPGGAGDGDVDHRRGERRAHGVERAAEGVLVAAHAGGRHALGRAQLVARARPRRRA